VRPHPCFRASILGASLLATAACVPAPGDARELLARRAPVLIVGGDAVLAGSSTTSCTDESPPSGDGDRWCAFTRPTLDAELVELWVVDVSAAARGSLPRCDGGDARCRLLTRTARRRTPSAFQGDTLLVYADAASTPDAPYVGPIAAWRPGWARPRQISSAHGLVCRAHPHAAVGACLDDLATDPTGVGRVHVRAGVLDAASDAPLPALGGTWPFTDDETSAWQLGFSPDGEIFVLSGPDAPGGVESLRVVATRDAAGQVPPPAIVDIQSWVVSNDGRRLYFKRTSPTGHALWAADFPTGDNPIMVSPRIDDYWSQGARPEFDGRRPEDRGVVFFERRGEDVTAFGLVRDHASASAPVTVFTYDDVVDDWAVSPDLRYTVWTDASFLGRVVRNADLNVCVMNPVDGRSIYKPAFLADASTLFWRELPPGATGGPLDAYYTTPERCGEKRWFAKNVDFFATVGADGLVFGDGHDEEARTVTLKVAARAGGGDRWPEGAVTVQAGVDAPIAILGTQHPLLVYEARGDEAHPPGIYVYGPLPF
jgi:hypothetical protein